MLMSKLQPNDLQMREFIGRKIYWRRKQLKLTQVKIAKKINVTFQQVQKFEKGSNGLVDMRIRSLAAALKIPESRIGFLIWKYNKKTKERLNA
jgi:transcriptional regulator with XRE-family HTH domain